MGSVSAVGDAVHGVAGDTEAPGVVTACGGLGAAGVTGEAGPSGVAAVTGVAGATSAICVVGASGVTGDGGMRIMGGVVTTGVPGEAAVTADMIVQSLSSLPY